MNSSAIRCSSLAKSYPRHTVFPDLDLSIPAQGVSAILGRNGAGKTTLIRLALGLARPTGGHIELLGAPPGVRARHVGYLSESLAVYPHLSAADNMRVAYDSAGLRPPRAGIIYGQLEQVGLSATGRRASRGFSLGMKRRLQLAMATMVRPVDLMVLDEPTNGLDIDGVAWLRGYVEAQAAAGASVIISTHALSELESLISHVTILHGGAVVLNEPWTHQSGLSPRLRLSFEPDEFARAAALLEVEGPLTLDESRYVVIVETKRPSREVLSRLEEAGVYPLSYGREQIGLEGVFRSVTADS